MDSYPHHITDQMTICALRFEGYRYMDFVNLDRLETEQIGLSDLSNPLVETLSFFENDHDNFATFFALQRFLHKWGGERLTKWSREHTAYDLLFLHLYRRAVPDAFALPSYVDRWQATPVSEREETAAFVRNAIVDRIQSPATGNELHTY